MTSRLLEILWTAFIVSCLFACAVTESDSGDDSASQATIDAGADAGVDGIRGPDSATGQDDASPLTVADTGGEANSAADLGANEETDSTRDGTDEEVATPTCELNLGDCPDGFVLDGDVCVVGCSGGCPTGEVCEAGICLPESGPRLLDTCVTQADCEGMVCEQIDDPLVAVDGNYCVHEGRCSDDDDCPGGGICHDTLGVKRCVRPCNPLADDPCGNDDLVCANLEYLGVSYCAWRFDCVTVIEEYEFDPCAIYESECDTSTRECATTVMSCEEDNLFCGDRHIFGCSPDGTGLVCQESCPEGWSCIANTCRDCGTEVERRCVDDEVYWFDDCGRQGERIERCEHGCASGACEAAPVCQLTCGSDSFSYTCGTGSSTTNYSYCSNGNPSGVTVRYSNGHTVSCTLNCSGYGGTCRDDTGASCNLR